MEHQNQNQVRTPRNSYENQSLYEFNAIPKPPQKDKERKSFDETDALTGARLLKRQKVKQKLFYSRRSLDSISYQIKMGMELDHQVEMEMQFDHQMENNLDKAVNEIMDFDAENEEDCVMIDSTPPNDETGSTGSSPNQNSSNGASCSTGSINSFQRQKSQKEYLCSTRESFFVPEPFKSDPVCLGGISLSLFSLSAMFLYAKLTGSTVINQSFQSKSRK